MNEAIRMQVSAFVDGELPENEADEPTITQPMMYSRIKNHKTTRQIYAERLENDGVIAPDLAKRMVDQYRDRLDEGKVVAGQVIEAVKNKAIRHFFLVGGCDGAKPGRDYYTKFVEQIPDDCVVLTLACGKFRFFDKDLGDIGVPELRPAQQIEGAHRGCRRRLAGIDHGALDTAVGIDPRGPEVLERPLEDQTLVGQLPPPGAVDEA